MKRSNPVWSTAANQDSADKLHLFNSFTKQKVSFKAILNEKKHVSL